MFGNYVVIFVLLFPFAAYGQPRAPFGPPGYEVPDLVTEENLLELGGRMSRDGCKLSGCIALRKAIGEVTDNPNRRKNPHLSWSLPPADIPYAAIKAREIDASLRDFRAIWPDICRAVVEIGARDEFVKWPATYTWIASAAIDVARHLTRPGLDCVGMTLAAMPASKRLQSALDTVYGYCINEGRGEARCKRFKPTDPAFLPIPPSRYVP